MKLNHYLMKLLGSLVVFTVLVISIIFLPITAIGAPLLQSTLTPTAFVYLPVLYGENLTLTPNPIETKVNTPTATDLPPPETSTPTDTTTPSLTRTARPTATQTVTATYTPTPTETSTPSPTHTATPTATQTVTATYTPTPTETNTPAPTSTPTDTSTPEPTPTNSDNLAWKPYLQQPTETGVIILWTTDTDTNSEVRYSTDTSYDLVGGGSSRTLSALGTQLHRVELTGLQPNTSYFYKVYTSGEDLLPGELLSFRTTPVIGSDTPFTFLAFGDFGRDNDPQKRLRDQMLLDSFDFILTTGDNAYADGTYAQFDQTVFRIYEDIFKEVTIFPTLGNHDYHTSSGAPYLDLFELPANAWRTNDWERYYSFDYGNVHFVALDTETPLRVDDSLDSDDMFDWLRDDLSRTTQPWKVAFFHRPPYSSGRHGSASRIQEKFVPIFETYGVNLVLTGHDHIYQRSKPLLGGQVTTAENGGITYIVSGAGAGANYSCSSADWSAISYCSQSYGLYSRITVNVDTMTIEAIDDQGAIKDLYLLSRRP